MIRIPLEDLLRLVEHVRELDITGGKETYFEYTLPQRTDKESTFSYRTVKVDNRYGRWEVEV